MLHYFSSSPMNNDDNNKLNDDDDEHDLLSSVYDRIKVMKKQEVEGVYQCYDYISQRQHHDDSVLMIDSNVNAKYYRSKMCQRCYYVAKVCKFGKETVAQAISLADRYISTTTIKMSQEQQQQTNDDNETTKISVIDKDEFQLIFMTAFSIALKINEHVIITANDVIGFVRGNKDSSTLMTKNLYYSEQDCHEMEIRMLLALQWKVTSGPTPHNFIMECCTALQIILTKSMKSKWSLSTTMQMIVTKIRNYAISQADLAICEYTRFVPDCAPSEIALAAMLNAIASFSKVCNNNKNKNKKVLSSAIKSEFICTIQNELGGIASLHRTLSIQSKLSEVHTNQKLKMTAAAAKRRRTAVVAEQQQQHDSNISNNNSYFDDDDDDDDIIGIPSDDDDESDTSSCARQTISPISVAALL